MHIYVGSIYKPTNILIVANYNLTSLFVFSDILLPLYYLILETIIMQKKKIGI